MFILPLCLYMWAKVYVPATYKCSACWGQKESPSPLKLRLPVSVMLHMWLMRTKLGFMLGQKILLIAEPPFRPQTYPFLFLLEV